jgi:NhaP-type Na+/H+ and K+/H+ antiporter
MIEKDPTTYTVLTYFWVFALAFWGGVVSFLSKIKQGAVRAFNITEFFGEICTSGLSGLLTFYLCELSQTPPLMTAVLVAISGHMGTRIIFLLEQYLEQKAKNVLNIDLGDSKDEV